MARRSKPQPSPPDFSQLFADYFANFASGVRFRVRQDANLRHDVAFLSGLIHDAEFRLSEISESRNRVVIHLKRDAWEHYRKKQELEQRDARLTFHPARVQRFACDKLSILGEMNSSPLVVESLSASLASEDNIDGAAHRTFTLLGRGWTLEITTPEFGFAVELRDVRPSK